MATTIEGLARTAANLARTEKITESHACAIEAWGSHIEEVQIDTEEATRSTRADLTVWVEDNAHNQGIDRVCFDHLHEEHSQRLTPYGKRQGSIGRCGQRCGPHARPTPQSTGH